MNPDFAAAIGAVAFAALYARCDGRPNRSAGEKSRKQPLVQRLIRPTLRPRECGSLSRSPRRLRGVRRHCRQSGGHRQGSRARYLGAKPIGDIRHLSGAVQHVVQELGTGRAFDSRQRTARWSAGTQHSPLFRLTISITVFLLKPTLLAMSRYDSPSAWMPSCPMGAGRPGVRVFALAIQSDRFHWSLFAMRQRLLLRTRYAPKASTAMMMPAAIHWSPGFGKRLKVGIMAQRLYLGVPLVGGYILLPLGGEERRRQLDSAKPAFKRTEKQRAWCAASACLCGGSADESQKGPHAVESE